MPPELQGQDLLPDTLENIHGDDKTAMQRVIICYTEDQTDEIATLLGLSKDDLEKKVVYRFDEIKK